jgi:hypothetical protein
MSVDAFVSAATLVGAGSFLLAGALKLTRRGRGSASTTALAALVPETLTDALPALWVATSLAEIGVGVGLITRRRSAAPVAGLLASSAVGYTAIAAWRTPKSPCGCLGVAAGYHKEMSPGATSDPFTPDAPIRARIKPPRTERAPNNSPASWWFRRAPSLPPGAQHSPRRHARRLHARERDLLPATVSVKPCPGLNLAPRYCQAHSPALTYPTSQRAPSRMTTVPPGWAPARRAVLSAPVSSPSAVAGSRRRGSDADRAAN